MRTSKRSIDLISLDDRVFVSRRSPLVAPIQMSIWQFDELLSWRNEQVKHILNNTKFLDLFLFASVVVHRLNTQFRLKMKVLFTVGTKRTSSSRALYNRSKRAHTTKRNSLEFRMWIARQTNATIYQSDDFLIYECNVNFLVFILFCSFVVRSRQRSVMGTCAPHKLRFVYKCTIF